MAVLAFPKIHSQSPPEAPGRAATHPVDSYLGRLAPNSRRGIRIALNNIARIASNGSCDAEDFDWQSLHYEDTARIREELTKRFATRTANYGLCALRGILKECWRLGLIGDEQYHRAIDVPNLKGGNSVTGRALTTEELQLLFKACDADHSAAGIRDGAIIAVLYSTGLRRSELTALNVSDYADGTLTVRGKGNKVRLAHLVGHSRARLEWWLRERGNGQPLFISINKSGVIGKSRLIGNSIARILTARAAQAGMKNFSPHDVRRTTATHLLEKGVDLLVVQKVLGHEHVGTTALYDRRGEEAKQKAAEVLEGAM